VAFSQMKVLRVIDSGDMAIRSAFLGPNELRSGWSLASYFGLFALFALAASWIEKLLSAGEPWSQMFRELGGFSAAVIAALIMGRIEKRRWSAYGLPMPGAFSKIFWVGAVWGFLGITILLEVLHGFDAFNFGHITLHGARIAEFAIFWALTFLLVGLFEEFLLRGYVQFTLARGIGFWPSAVLLSCLCGTMHLRNKGEAWNGALAVATTDLFLCLTVRRTGTLWFAVGFHAAWDWGESFLYSVPDSGEIAIGHLLSSSLRGPNWLTGGLVGPEGSLLCFFVTGVMWVIFSAIYPRAISTDEATHNGTDK
jgi:membrane protease YdiL (CAAX protease family)